MISEPYRLFFPLGTLLLLCGILLWLPQIWSPGDYPVLLHRSLMLNGFVASFIGGFLMTAVPKFSKTDPAKSGEVITFLLIAMALLVVAHLEQEKWVNVLSALQPLCILLFLFKRISKRKENPPYTFVFIFVGLLLWVISALGSAFIDPEQFKVLHYEGAISAIIFGVGGRLIPGILGHVEIVSAQRLQYETPKSVLSTVPRSLIVIMATFVISYFFESRWSEVVRAIDAFLIGLLYFQIQKLPRERTSLTWCIWTSAWLIVGSFLLRAFWPDGGVHASHSFFINGIVLMSLLIGTRVLQSHGPNDKKLENAKLLYVVTSLIVFSAATRVTAYLMPEGYLRHLGYSSLLLALAVFLWGWKYLRFVRVFKG